MVVKEEEEEESRRRRRGRKVELATVPSARRPARVGYKEKGVEWARDPRD